jgi:hypothetical protein
MMMKFILAACLGFGATSAVARPVVVELFTSQGCSSCPPADAVLARLATQKDVIAISWPVTYWDHLGWKDTLARPANTKRQYEYAAMLQENGVYTPQAIIDGVSHMVGSQLQQIATKIADRRNLRDAVTLSVTRAANGEVQIKTGAVSEPVDIRLVSLKASETVFVGRGENSKRKLTYTNIATADVIVATGTAARTLQIAAPASDRAAVLVESKKTRAILAAALLTLR